jgi:orotidine-5'-phosphate decarboxylase
LPRKNFRHALHQRWDSGIFLCVGLDTDPNKIPKHIDFPHVADRMYNFNMEIVEATKDLACAYKPNRVFYDVHDNEGATALLRTISGIHEVASEVVVILDQKRDDPQNNNLYVKESFEGYLADAVTVHSTVGQEGLQPFLNETERGIIVLCKTSNQGSVEFQDRLVAIPKEEFNELLGDSYSVLSANGLEPTQHHVLIPFYQYVALRVDRVWNMRMNCGLVVGATFPEQLAQVRRLAPYMPILIPGIGAQGGDLEATVKAGKDANGQGMIINVSSALIYASDGKDFAKAARAYALKLTQQINRFRGA